MNEIVRTLIERELKRLEEKPEEAKILLKQLEKQKKHLNARIKKLKDDDAARLARIEELKTLLDGSNNNP